MAASKEFAFEIAGVVPTSVEGAASAEPRQAKTRDEPAGQARPRRETKTSRRQDATTSRRQDVETPEPRIAYTWRLTRDESDQVDRFTVAVRDAAGETRLDRAAMLKALFNQLDQDPGYAKKVARQHRETS